MKTKRNPKGTNSWLVTLYCCLVGSSALGADTLETWDQNAFDVDFTLGVEKLTQGEDLGGQVMLGYGLTNRIGIFIGSNMEEDSAKTPRLNQPFWGVFGTLVETEHIDLDALLELSWDQGQLNLQPMIEINWDQSPGMDTWGFYSRLAVPIETEGSFHLEGTLGAYWVFLEGHQVLIEPVFSFNPDAQAHKRQFAFEKVALGYNVVLSDTFEWITEIATSIPQANAQTQVAFTTGFIATL